MSTILEQYRVADFLEWHRERKLVLNPDFQRGSVWTPAARTFLIDTILRGFPIPKIYLRTQIDPATQKGFREVVDGQQRLRAILDFADDKLVLTKRAGDLARHRYSTLDEDHQKRFLEYPISVGQLLNASNDDVLEVFSRLNSYTVQLNPPEKRHARFQGDFKWAVRNASRRWATPLFEDCRILTTKERVRMLDDSLMAELFGVALEGIQDGGQKNIDKLYSRQDSLFSDDDPRVSAIDDVLGFVVEHFATAFTDTPLFSPPHFLMLCAALAHRRHGIPQGALDALPPSPGDFVRDLSDALSNLLELASIIASPSPSTGRFEAFWKASAATTHRIASRRVRFPFYFDALA